MIVMMKQSTLSIYDGPTPNPKNLIKSHSAVFKAFIVYMTFLYVL